MIRKTNTRLLLAIQTAHGNAMIKRCSENNYGKIKRQAEPVMVSPGMLPGCECFQVKKNS